MTVLVFRPGHLDISPRSILVNRVKRTLSGSNVDNIYNYHRENKSSHRFIQSELNIRVE